MSLKIKVLKTGDAEESQEGNKHLASKGKVHDIIPEADEESLTGVPVKILADEEPPKQSGSAIIDDRELEDTQKLQPINDGNNEEQKEELDDYEDALNETELASPRAPMPDSRSKQDAVEVKKALEPEDANDNSIVQGISIKEDNLNLGEH